MVGEKEPALSLRRIARARVFSPPPAEGRQFRVLGLEFRVGAAAKLVPNRNNSKPETPPLDANYSPPLPRFVGSGLPEPAPGGGGGCCAIASFTICRSCCCDCCCCWICCSVETWGGER